MRIVHVLEAVGGGTALHVRLLAEGQARSGAAVTVVAPEERSDGLYDGTFWTRLRGAGVESIKIPFHKVPIHHQNISAARRLAELIRTSKPDIVHSHSLTAGAIARPLARRAGIATVHTPNGQRFAADRAGVGGLAEYALERLMAPITDRVIAIGESEAHVLRRVYPARRIVVVPSGIPAPKEPLPRFPIRPRIVFVGRLAKEKQPELAVRVMALVRRRRTDVEALMVGDGPLAKRVESLIAKLDQGIKLVRHGMSGGVDALSTASALLITSLRESGPYVALEAMGFGRPVVAGDVPGCRDIIVHDETGLLFAPRSLVDAAESLLQLIDDPIRARQMGAAGRRRLLARYTDDRTRQGVDDVYDDVLSAK